MSKPSCAHKPKGYSRYMLVLYIIFTLAGLSACQSKEVDLSFETVEQRDASGTGQVYQDRQPGLIVITTPEEAASLDALVTPEAQARLQSLDYDAYFASVVFQGRKSTTGYGIAVERITRFENKVTIRAQSLEPKPNAEKAPEETSPYHVIQVQKSGTWGQPISFDLIVDNVVVTSFSHYVP